MEGSCHDNKPGFEVAFVGDVFLKTRSGTERPFCTQIEASFRRIPWLIVNLETVLTEGGCALQKSYRSRSNPDMALYLREIGINAVNLANNHTFDYGPDGFRHTLSALETAGVSYFGVLKDGQQQPFLFRVGGCHIGILGYTIGSEKDVEIGTASIDRVQIKEDLVDLKARNVDRIVINLHWGEEYVDYPSPEQQRLGRELIDCGADMIIGHHPHVVQGIEQYKDGVIFYSLGNFNFINSGKVDRMFPGTQWGLIALLRLSQSTPVEYSYFPVQIDKEYRPFMPPRIESEAFLEYLAQISEPLVPEIEKLFWLREASWPHFRNHLPSFIIRIKKYGLRHFIQMVRWLLSSSNYGFYIGLILKMASKINRVDKSPESPRPLSQNAN